MIVYTIKETVVASQRFPELTCPLCHATGEIEIAVLQRQINIAFIPMLAAGKSGVAECHHCGQQVALKQGGETFQKAFKTFKSTVRTPLYLYSGLVFCLAGLIAIFATIAYQDNHNPYTQPIDQAQLDAPQSGDLYEVSVISISGSAAGIIGHTVARVERAGNGAVTLRWHRKLVPIEQKMPFIQDFPTSASDFEDATMEAVAARLRRRLIVRQGVQGEIVEATGDIVATLRPPAQ